MGVSPRKRSAASVPQPNPPQSLGRARPASRSPGATERAASRSAAPPSAASRSPAPPIAARLEAQHGPRNEPSRLESSQTRSRLRPSTPSRPAHRAGPLRPRRSFPRRRRRGAVALPVAHCSAARSSRRSPRRAVRHQGRTPRRRPHHHAAARRTRGHTAAHPPSTRPTRPRSARHRAAPRLPLWHPAARHPRAQHPAAPHSPAQHPTVPAPLRLTQGAPSQARRCPASKHRASRRPAEPRRRSGRQPRRPGRPRYHHYGRRSPQRVFLRNSPVARRRPLGWPDQRSHPRPERQHSPRQDRQIGRPPDYPTVPGWALRPRPPRPARDQIPQQDRRVWQAPASRRHRPSTPPA
jgi:hypothetical protein